MAIPLRPGQLVPLLDASFVCRVLQSSSYSIKHHSLCLAMKALPSPLPKFNSLSLGDFHRLFVYSIFPWPLYLNVTSLARA